MHPCTHVAQAALHDGTLHALPSTVSRLLVHTRDTLTLPSLQDHILPYMADERHAGDTLFLVCEEDFRLFARDSVCNPAALNQLATAAYAASSTAWKARHPLPCFEEPAEPVAAVGVRAIHQAALETHRMSTGRRASGFEPQRNTFYVLGRPVQVLA